MNSPSLSISIYEISIMALLGIILFVVQVALGFLPNLELVSLLLLLYARNFPLRQNLGSVYLFALLEGLIYGFGVWWAMYLYVWPLFLLGAWLLRRVESLPLLAVFSGGFGLAFGALCALPYIIAGGIAYGVSWWISGIPFDIAHCFGNCAVVLVLFRPLEHFFKGLGPGTFHREGKR